MKKLFLALVGLFFSASTAYGAPAAVADNYPEEFVRTLNNMSIAGGSELMVSDAQLIPEATNFPDYDAWVSKVINPITNGNLLLTLHSDKKAEDKIMAAVLTISYQNAVDSDTPEENLQLANDFLLTLGYGMGLKQGEVAKLFELDFIRDHKLTSELAARSVGKKIQYNFYNDLEHKIMYFVITADDVLDEWLGDYLDIPTATPWGI